MNVRDQLHHFERITLKAARTFKRPGPASAAAAAAIICAWKAMENAATLHGAEALYAEGLDLMTQFEKAANPQAMTSAWAEIVRWIPDMHGAAASLTDEYVRGETTIGLTDAATKALSIAGLV